jgi:hypothetical protein
MKETPMMRVSMPPRSSLWTSTWLFGLLALIVVVAVFVLPALALGQTAGASPDEFGAFLRAFLDAPVIGKVVLGLVAGVWLLRKFGTKIPWGVGSFLATSEGGTVFALFAAVVAYVGAAYVGGVPVTLALVGKALSAAVVAGGGWTMARRLLRLVSPLVARIPRVGAPLAKVFDVLSGATAKQEIAAKTTELYKTMRPGPTAEQAADILSKPPVP